MAAPVLAQAPARPEWSQFQAGPGHPGTLPEGPAPPYRVRWTLPAPEGPALSGAAIHDGLAFSVGERAVYAVELATGEVAWEVERSGGPISVPAVVAGGERGSGMLLFLDGPAGAEADASPTPTPSPTGSPSAGEVAEGPGSDLVAVDLESRDERWRTALDAVSRTGVTVDDGSAYVGDQDGGVYAVGLEDGAVLWKADSGAMVDQSVAVVGDDVVALARNLDEGTATLNAFDRATGDVAWPAFSPQIGSSAASAPAGADGRVVVGFADRLVRALDAEGGEQLWDSLVVNILSPVTSPALPSGSVIVADLGGGVYRLDAEDGGRDWGFQLNELVLRSSPVVSGETVLLGTNDGRLVALDAGSGHLVWQSRATPGLVGTIALSGELVVATKGGRDAGLVAFEHDPGGTLSDEASPTELDAAATFGRFGAAAAIVLVVVLVPAMLLGRRFGGAVPVGGDETDDDPEGAAETDAEVEE